MNENFFYKYAEDITKLFGKYNVENCSIQRTGIYASLYLDIKESAGYKLINLENDMLHLANQHSEVVHINYISYNLKPEPFISFTDFLKEGMFKNAIRGEKIFVENIAKVVGINSLNASNQSVLLATFKSFTSSCDKFDNKNAEIEKYLLIKMQKLEKLIKWLIDDLQSKDLKQDSMLIEAFNSLSLKKINNNDNIVQANKIIVNIAEFLDSKNLLLKDKYTSIVDNKDSLKSDKSKTHAEIRVLNPNKLFKPVSSSSSTNDFSNLNCSTF